MMTRPLIQLVAVRGLSDTSEAHDKGMCWQQIRSATAMASPMKCKGKSEPYLQLSNDRSSRHILPPQRRPSHLAPVIR